jgi:tRNA acetyltransferase TAN1
MKAVERKRKKHYSDGPKRKKYKKSDIHDMRAGMQGILITTNGRERDCINEARRLLNEYAEKLFCPSLGASGGSSLEGDIESDLSKEISSMKSDRAEMIDLTNSGAKNVIFMKTNPPLADPCHLVHHMLSDIKDNKLHKTRYCLRVIPVTSVCRATLEDIKKCAKDVLRYHFHTKDYTSLQFSVHYKCRYNTVIKRDDVIRLLASVATDEGGFDHIVNLTKPELVICAEVVKGLCCLSVVRDFHSLKQYNMNTIVESFIECEKKEANTSSQDTAIHNEEHNDDQ